jgi:hypothetical protein
MSLSNCMLQFNELHDTLLSPDGIVCTATRVRTERSGSRFPTRPIFSQFPKLRDRLWDPHSLSFNGHRSSIPWVKRPGREVDPSSPSCAEVKNEWRYVCSPYMTWKGKRFSLPWTWHTVSCKFCSCSTDQNLSKGNWLKYTSHTLSLTQIWILSSSYS